MIQTGIGNWGGVHPESPKIITKDHRGTEICEGLRVAYNRSGDTIIGKIINVHKNKWKYIESRKFWRLTYEIHIEAEDGKVSKVKNPNSFVII
jgi:hypothetical protein